MPAKKKRLRNLALGLEALPENVLADLDTWLVQRGLGYKAVIAKLKQKHGKSTSADSLSRYFRRHYARLIQIPAGLAPGSRITAVAGAQILITVTLLPPAKMENPPQRDREG